MGGGSEVRTGLSGVWRGEGRSAKRPVASGSRGGGGGLRRFWVASETLEAKQQRGSRGRGSRQTPTIGFILTQKKRWDSQTARDAGV